MARRYLFSEGVSLSNRTRKKLSSSAEWESIGAPVQEPSGAWKQELVLPVPASGEGARVYRARVVP
jgi:hypothetical protein